MAHALLSPSSASRWMKCTPSVRLEEHYPDETSEFAEEGTLAHALAELYLTHRDNQAALDEAFTYLQDDPLYQKYYNHDLDQHAQNFANYVLEKCSGDYALEVEQRLDMTEWIEEGFGTADAIVVKDGVLDMHDLKFGRGVRVSAVENRQLMVYGLGCIAKYSWIYDFHTVRLTIYQPRMDNISVWSITVDELLAWGEEELKPKAQLAFKGEGEQVPGEHCRFCKAKGECRALAEQALELAKYEFKDEETGKHKLTPQEVGEIMPKIAVVEIFIKAVREHVYNTLLSGGKIPGYKLVKGKQTRVFDDPTKIKEELLKAGFPEDKILTKPAAPALLGLTALEKALGKKAFNLVVSPYVKKVEGGPAVAEESDKRDEYNSAHNEFASEEETDPNAWMS